MFDVMQAYAKIYRSKTWHVPSITLARVLRGENWRNVQLLPPSVFYGHRLPVDEGGDTHVIGDDSTTPCQRAVLSAQSFSVVASVSEDVSDFGGAEATTARELARRLRVAGMGHVVTQTAHGGCATPGDVSLQVPRGYFVGQCPRPHDVPPQSRSHGGDVPVGDILESRTAVATWIRMHGVGWGLESELGTCTGMATSGCNTSQATQAGSQLRFKFENLHRSRWTPLSRCKLRVLAPPHELESTGTLFPVCDPAAGGDDIEQPASSSCPSVEAVLTFPPTVAQLPQPAATAVNGSHPGWGAGVPRSPSQLPAAGCMEADYVRAKSALEAADASAADRVRAMLAGKHIVIFGDSVSKAGNYAALSCPALTCQCTPHITGVGLQCFACTFSVLDMQVSRYSFMALVWFLHFGTFLTRHSDIFHTYNSSSVGGGTNLNRTRSRKMGIVDAVVDSIGNIRMDCGESGESGEGGHPLPDLFVHDNGIVDVVFDPASSPPGRKLERMIDYCVMYYHDPKWGLNVTYVTHGKVAIGQHPIGRSSLGSYPFLLKMPLSCYFVIHFMLRL